jgi:hypothetical protein
MAGIRLHVCILCMHEMASQVIFYHSLMLHLYQYIIIYTYTYINLHTLSFLHLTHAAYLCLTEYIIYLSSCHNPLCVGVTFTVWVIKFVEGNQ